MKLIALLSLLVINPKLSFSQEHNEYLAITPDEICYYKGTWNDYSAAWRSCKAAASAIQKMGNEQINFTNVNCRDTKKDECSEFGNPRDYIILVSKALVKLP